MSRGSIKRRDNSWRARHYVDGVEKQRTFRTRGEAARWLNEQLAQVQAGTWISPEAGSMTFREHSTAWLATQHVRGSTRDVMERRLRLQIWPVLGALPLARIRRSHVVAMVTRCATDEALSPSVTRHALSMTRAVLDAAVSDRLIPANPAGDRSISVPRAATERYVPLAAAQVAAIADHIEPHLRAAVVLAAASGLRPSELFGLTLDRCIGLAEAVAGDGTVTELAARREPASRGAITLRIDRQAANGRGFAPTKTRSSVRDVPIPGTVTAVLVEHVHTFGVGVDALLFRTASGRMVSRARASEIWQRAVATLDVPASVSWHGLRHFHASALLSAGVSIAYVSKRLGHANAAITLGIYSHALPSDDDRVLAASAAIAQGLA